jgi:argininosuccinate lyase
MPFRTAHEVSGKIARDLYEAGRDYAGLTLDDWRKYSDLFDRAIFDAVTPEAAVAARLTPQSTNPAAVAAALADVQQWLALTPKETR